MEEVRAVAGVSRSLHCARPTCLVLLADFAMINTLDYCNAVLRYRILCALLSGTKYLPSVVVVGGLPPKLLSLVLLGRPFDCKSFASMTGICASRDISS